jgi:hypothetical protein
MMLVLFACFLQMIRNGKWQTDVANFERRMMQRPKSQELSGRDGLPYVLLIAANVILMLLT